MKKPFLFILIVITLAAFLLNGCDGGFIPPLPDGDYDEVNTEIAYFKILPAKVEMKVNQSKTFEVKRIIRIIKRLKLTNRSWNGRCFIIANPAA